MNLKIIKVFIFFIMAYIVLLSNKIEYMNDSNCNEVCISTIKTDSTRNKIDSAITDVKTAIEKARKEIKELKSKCKKGK